MALVRCGWCGEDPLYRHYHDREWGVPEHDARALFEKLILDGFQAGLSWITILRKREHFRVAFDGFQPGKIARYSPRKVEFLLADPGIVRNRQKVESALGSARAWLRIEESHPGGFDAYLWRFTQGRTRLNAWKTLSQIPARTPESEAMSKELHAAGFRFVGPTICYAFMQAVGMVHDHLADCHRYGKSIDHGRRPA